MKITKSQLQKIINEELASLNEQQEADQIVAEVCAHQESMNEISMPDAATLEKGAAAAAKAGNLLAKIVANPTAKKWMARLLKKAKLGFVGELLLDLTPDDVQGLQALAASARGGLDTVAKTTAQPVARTVALSGEARPDDPTVAMSRE
tara:strand:- start:145 stop:591 length:447 start_codon:yes stop_codon:yes gene_type:complete